MTAKVIKCPYPTQQKMGQAYAGLLSFWMQQAEDLGISGLQNPGTEEYQILVHLGKLFS